MEDLAIRTCSQAEVSLLLSWAKGEGWNPGTHDALPFHIADPRGFFVALLGDQPVGGVAAIRYGTSFGFIGLYLVRPEFRGMGFGLQLWRRALDYLQGIPAGLDGVVAQQQNYARSGFVLAHRHIRHGGAAPFVGKRTELLPLKQVPFGMLADYDARHFPAARPGFLAAWVAMPESFGLALVEHDHLLGYGLIRKCQQGNKIGPLFADAPEVADSLLLGLCAEVPGEQVFLDVPEANGAGMRLAGKCGLKPVFETARMYKGPVPAVDLSHIYGVTTFELG